MEAQNLYPLGVQPQTPVCRINPCVQNKLFYRILLWSVSRGAVQGSELGARAAQSFHFPLARGAQNKQQSPWRSQWSLGISSTVPRPLKHILHYQQKKLLPFLPGLAVFHQLFLPTALGMGWLNTKGCCSIREIFSSLSCRGDFSHVCVSQA